MRAGACAGVSGRVRRTAARQGCNVRGGVPNRGRAAVRAMCSCVARDHVCGRAQRRERAFVVNGSGEPCGKEDQATAMLVLCRVVQEAWRPAMGHRRAVRAASRRDEHEWRHGERGRRRAANRLPGTACRGCVLLDGPRPWLWQNGQRQGLEHVQGWGWCSCSDLRWRVPGRCSRMTG